MYLTWILGGTLALSVVAIFYYRQRWMNSKMNYAMLKGDLADEIRKRRHLASCGCRNLKVRTGVICIHENQNIGFAEVIGQDTQSPDFTFVVKTFYFDPFDDEDREYATSQANELIETIIKF